MSNASQGSGWWRGPDGKWNPPVNQMPPPGPTPPAQPTTPAQPPVQQPPTGQLPPPPNQPPVYQAPTQQPPPYQQQPPIYTSAPPVYYAPVGPRFDGMSVAALVCGIVGLVLVFCWVGIVLGVLGVVFGVLGMNRVGASGGTLQGRGLAIAGGICGAVTIAIFILLLIFVLANSSNSSTYLWS
jgi:hypothetical protein